MPKKKWSELTPLQKRAVYVTGAAETALTAAALFDLVRRPSARVRGPKAAWALSLLVQPFGPLAYFVAARR